MQNYWRPILAIGLAAYTGGLAGTAIYDSLASTVTISTFGVATVTVPLFASAGAELAVAAGAGAVAGGVFGASMTALYGGNASDVLSAGLRGAAIGGLAGGAWWAAGEVSAAWGFAGQALAHGVAGGLTGVAAGGSFKKGFELAVLAYGAFRLYKWMADKQDPRWTPGNGTQEKPLHMPASNESEALNNVGKAVRPGESICGVCEGSTFSNAINQFVPGSNAFSTLHDIWADGLSNTIFYSNPSLYYLTFNIPSLVPAAPISYVGLLNTTIGSSIVASDIVYNNDGP